MSEKYAKGSRAWGQCSRSGKRLLLNDMVFDGHMPNIRVAPDWYEPRHPQEKLVKVDDPIALWRPAPIPSPGGDNPILAVEQQGSCAVLTWTPAVSGEADVIGYRAYVSTDGSTFTEFDDLLVERDEFGDITFSPDETEYGIAPFSTYYFYVIAYGSSGLNLASPVETLVTGITDVTATIVASSSGTTSPFNIPMSSFARKDLALLIVFKSHSTATTINPPVGWSTLYDARTVSAPYNGGTTYPDVFIFFRFCNDGESDYQFTFSGGLTGWLYRLIRYKNVDMDFPFDGFHVSKTSHGTIRNFSDVTIGYRHSFVPGYNNGGETNNPRLSITFSNENMGKGLALIHGTTSLLDISRTILSGGTNAAAFIIAERAPTASVETYNMLSDPLLSATPFNSSHVVGATVCGGTLTNMTQSVFSNPTWNYYSWQFNTVATGSAQQKYVEWQVSLVAGQSYCFWVEGSCDDTAAMFFSVTPPTAAEFGRYHQPASTGINRYGSNIGAGFSLDTDNAPGSGGASFTTPVRFSNFFTATETGVHKLRVGYATTAEVRAVTTGLATIMRLSSVGIMPANGPAPIGPTVHFSQSAIPDNYKVMHGLVIQVTPLPTPPAALSGTEIITMAFDVRQACSVPRASRVHIQTAADSFPQVVDQDGRTFSTMRLPHGDNPGFPTAYVVHSFSALDPAVFAAAPAKVYYEYKISAVQNFNASGNLCFYGVLSLDQVTGDSSQSVGLQKDGYNAMVVSGVTADRVVYEDGTKLTGTNYALGAVGDVLGLGVDYTNRKINYYRNGTLLFSANMGVRVKVLTPFLNPIHGFTSSHMIGEFRMKASQIQFLPTGYEAWEWSP